MLRLALIGCSRDAERYAPFASRLTNAAFAVVADRNRDEAEHAARLLKADASGDFEELFTTHNREFDAVVIHAAVPLRFELAMRAARLKKHVLVEAPLAVSKHEADAVIAACRDSDVRLMVGQSSRFHPSVMAVKASLDRGQLGKPALFRAHHWKPGESELPNNAHDDAPAWSRLVGDLDLAQWMFGRSPSHIYAVAAHSSPGQYVQIHLGFPEGGSALIDRAETLPPGDSYSSLALIGESGAAYADDHDNVHLLYRGGAPTALRATPERIAWMNQLREFISSIHEGREPAVTGTDGRAAIETADAVMQSISNHRALRWTGADYELV